MLIPFPPAVMGVVAFAVGVVDRFDKVVVSFALNLVTRGASFGSGVVAPDLDVRLDPPVEGCCAAAAGIFEWSLMFGDVHRMEKVWLKLSKKTVAMSTRL